MLAAYPELDMAARCQDSQQQTQREATEAENLRMKRLEALMACVMDLSNIERQIDALSDRFCPEPSQDSQGYLCFEKGGNVCDNRTTVAVASPPPSQWYRKESKSHPGKMYWVHKETGKTSWKNPEPEVTGVEVAQSQYRAAIPMPMKGGKPGKNVMSDAELSTDCGGYTSMSDYDSDVPWRSSIASKQTFKANAPVFTPTSSIVVSRETFLRQRGETVDCNGPKYGISARSRVELGC